MPAPSAMCATGAATATISAPTPAADTASCARGPPPCFVPRARLRTSPLEPPTGDDDVDHHGPIPDPRPYQAISPAEIREAAASGAWPGAEDGSETRSWRGELPRLRPADGAQGAHHRGRFRYRPGGGHRLRAGRR